MYKMPFELINYIYEYDGRYKILYNKVIEDIKLSKYNFDKYEKISKYSMYYDSILEIDYSIDNDFIYYNEFYKFALKMINNNVNL